MMIETHPPIPVDVSTAISSIINGGGKRLRPALVLLSSYMCGADLEKAVPVAAAVEMLHTATLIHDDLIDDATMRRGVQTLNASWTAVATVLAGDMAFAWAAKLATRGQDLRLMARFSETLETICGGELTQMFNGRRTIPTVESYYERIFAKTASLFALTTEAGPLLAGYPHAETRRLRHFGGLLGEAFQIVDDVLDFMSTEEMLGKPVGGDLRQGLITLPVLYYLEQHPGDPRIQTVLDRTEDEAVVQSLVADLRRSDAADRAMVKAEAHITEALSILDPYPDTAYRRAMREIAEFAVHRRY